MWLTLGLVIAIVAGRTLWVYRGSSKWPVADGTIKSLDVEKKRDAGGGCYFCATFTYEFPDLDGNLRSGTWTKNFSSEAAARDFAGREMPMGKQVVVHFNPNDPGICDLELDSFAYTDDRPTSLGL
ncbi:DUF3592 domain-containing protein [Occallatibacter savannae]|uniref:DUF3592 domain-containing protein n=1 Tax=Occallatibacter savannae TaxID=1002691 RepID=UPI0013A5740C|nr:DUF3592 domain-containing protein [Occallatibacter savannae]